MIIKRKVAIKDDDVDSANHSPVGLSGHSISTREPPHRSSWSWSVRLSSQVSMTYDRTDEKVSQACCFFAQYPPPAERSNRRPTTKLGEFLALKTVSHPIHLSWIEEQNGGLSTLPFRISFFNSFFSQQVVLSPLLGKYSTPDHSLGAHYKESLQHIEYAALAPLRQSNTITAAAAAVATARLPQQQQSPRSAAMFFIIKMPSRPTLLLRLNYIPYAPSPAAASAAATFCGAHRFALHWSPLSPPSPVIRPLGFHLDVSVPSASSSTLAGRHGSGTCRSITVRGTLSLEMNQQ